jgi:uncharacterized protein YciI
MDDVYFIAVSEYLVPDEVVLDNLVEHRAWSKKAYDDGLMLFSGRQDPPTGGVLAFKAPSHAAAEAFIASDPFAIAGVASYRVIGFTPTHHPWRSGAFDAFASGP